VLWTTAGDGTFDDASVLNAFYTPGSNDTAAGSVELTLTANAVDPCVDSVADTVMISIQPAPTVEAGDAQTICADASASLSGSATDYATVSWTTGGDGTFDFPSELDPVYTPGSSDLAAGSVVLTLTANPVAPCATPAADTVTITIQALPTAEAGDAQTICEDASASLSGSATDYATVSWTTGGDGTFDFATELDPLYTPGLSDLTAGSVVLTLTANPMAPCATTAADTVTITIQALPTVEAGDPQTICGDASASLSGLATDYATVLWSTAGDGTFDDATVLNAVYTPGTNDIAGGGVVLTLTANPMAPCATTAADTVTISIQALPTVEAGDAQTICGDASASLSGSATDYATVLWTTGGDGMFDDATVLDPVYTPGSSDIEGGSVELTLTANAVGPCVGSVADTVMITIQPAPAAEAGDPQTICAGETAGLTGQASDYLDVLWTTPGDGTFDDASALNAVYTPGSSDITAGSVVLTLTANPITPCATPEVDTVTITIQALPVPVITGDPLEACDFTTVTLDAGVFDGYLWSTGETTQTIDVTVTGPISGKWSESFVGGEPGGLGNVVHAASAEGLLLGGEWEVTGPTLVDAVEIENTVDGQGNGYIILQTTYDGGTLYVDPELWGADGSMITADIQDYIHTTTFFYVSYEADLPASWTDVSFTATSLDGPELAVTGIATYLNQGTGMPTSWPEFLGGVNEGQWGFMHALTIGVTYDVTVTLGVCEGTDSIVVTADALPDCTITAPITIPAGSGGHVASVRNAGAGAIYTWDLIGNGTIDQDYGYLIEFSSTGTAGDVLTLTVTVELANGCTDTCFADVSVTGG
jgi:hypothetical protein